MFCFVFCKNRREMILCPFQCNISKVHDVGMSFTHYVYPEYLVTMGSAGCLHCEVIIFSFVVVKYLGIDTLRKSIFLLQILFTNFIIL